jgi:hypothetical protein
MGGVHHPDRAGEWPDRCCVLDVDREIGVREGVEQVGDAQSVQLVAAHLADQAGAAPHPAQAGVVKRYAHAVCGHAGVGLEIAQAEGVRTGEGVQHVLGGQAGTAPVRDGQRA